MPPALPPDQSDFVSFTKELNKYRGQTVSQTKIPLYKRAGSLILAPAKFTVNWFKVYEPRWRTTLVLVLLAAILGSVFFYGSQAGRAATFTFVQTSWSGGLDAGSASHPGNQTGWDRYSAQTNIDFATAGALKVASSENSVLDITTGLQGYWKMDEGTGATSADSSGNGNTATILGTQNTDWRWASAKIGNGWEKISSGGGTARFNAGSAASLDDLASQGNAE